MAATLLQGAVIAQQVYTQLKTRIETLRAKGVQPGLAAILVGDNAASRIYLKNKAQACDDVGVHSEVFRFAEDCTEDAVFATLQQLNANSSIHGVLVQLPLPRHLNSDRILQAISPEKDVDGFNWLNLGAMVAGHTLLAPCTPLGVMTMLDYAQVPIEGRSAVVVGRSAIVGKPLALMLIARGATVTVCSSKTPDLRPYTCAADIVAVAAGRAAL